MSVNRAIARLGVVGPLALVLATTGVAVVSAQPSSHAPAETVDRPTWMPFPDAIQRAERSGKMVLVDVWSASCGWCARMQREVYTRPELLEYLNEHFETGRLDIDVRTDTISYMGYELSSAELSVAFGATGTPTTVFLSPDGSYVTRLPGFHDFDRFIRVLRFIGSESFREMSYEEYLERSAGDDG